MQMSRLAASIRSCFVGDILYRPVGTIFILNSRRCQDAGGSGRDLCAFGALNWWRGWELNPRPEILSGRLLHPYPAFFRSRLSVLLPAGSPQGQPRLGLAPNPEAEIRASHQCMTPVSRP